MPPPGGGLLELELAMMVVGGDGPEYSGSHEKKGLEARLDRRPRVWDHLKKNKKQSDFDSSRGNMVFTSPMNPVTPVESVG